MKNLGRFWIALFSMSVLSVQGMASTSKVHGESTFEDFKRIHLELQAVAEAVDYANEGSEQDRMEAIKKLGLAWFGLCSTDLPQSKPEPKAEEGELSFSSSAIGLLANVYTYHTSGPSTGESMIKTVPLLNGLESIPATVAAAKRVHASKGQKPIELGFDGSIKNWQNTYEKIKHDLSPVYSPPDKAGKFSLYHKGKVELGFQVQKYTNQAIPDKPVEEILLSAFCPKEDGCDWAEKHFQRDQLVTICFYTQLTKLQGVDAEYLKNSIEPPSDPVK